MWVIVMHACDDVTKMMVFFELKSIFQNRNTQF
jgi:hypothetical protein